MEREFETGQILVNKRRCWRALRLALWFNEHADFYYRYLHGDKETFHLAFRKLGTSYALVATPIHTLPGTMCQHDFSGRRIFQHRNTDKWSLWLHNREARGFRFEQECREYVRQLQRLWDGRMTAWTQGHSPVIRESRPPRIATYLISCPEREQLRNRTLRDLAQTDWGMEPVVVQWESAPETADPQVRQTQTALQALQRSLDGQAEYVLLLEDDLEFNRYLRHNLLRWQPLRAGWITLASLYNPGLFEAACDVQHHTLIVEPRNVFGSQAFLLSRAAVEYVVRHWHRVHGLQDIRMSRLAGRLGQPLYCHAPSLVQHVGRESLWGGTFHQAPDFVPDWRAG
jgi:hypothetical protein